RALARLPSGPLSVVLLFDEELLARVPVEEHDRPVRAALTPSELHRFDRRG
ncbi:MAG: 5-formyltetrahydrofolate cyclo-ligase, partial [Actinomycetota bacterium]|nr:5-formyltetrahydrofolate cyclo-ligase [Actinomycetota bacterium]